jgi:hemerythrin superfamily protein
MILVECFLLTLRRQDTDDVRASRSRRRPLYAPRWEIAMDIFTHLVNDHEKVASLMSGIESTTNPANRQALCTDLKEAVLTHSKAEEETFYARLEGVNAAQDLIAEARAEHQMVERLLHEIDGLDADSEDWMDRFMELKESIEDHVDQEETEIFDVARDVFDAGEAVRLDQQMQRAENRVHPT